MRLAGVDISNQRQQSFAMTMQAATADIAGHQDQEFIAADACNGIARLGGLAQGLGEAGEQRVG